MKTLNRLLQLTIFICLLSVSALAQDCVHPTHFTDTEVNYNNDATYPVGSVLASNGDLKVIKTLTSAWVGNFDQTTISSISAVEVFHHGYLTFDVSSVTNTCRDLTIEAFAEKVIIDGDTVNVNSIAFPYQGNGFLLDTISSGVFNILGNFNQVDIWIQTGIFYSACLSACPPPPTGCLNPSSFSDATANYNDDMQYPIGSVLTTNGDLEIIKTGSSTWGPNHTSILFVNPNEVQYNGNLTFDVSNASYSCRDLTIEGQYWSQIDIDGDTLNLYSISYPYTNGNYTIDTLDAYNSFSISGNFDQATVMSPNGIFFSACLGSCSTPPAGCVNATSFTDNEVNYNNDITYPVGSVLASGGNIEIIKTLSSPWSNPGYFQQTTISSMTSSEIYFHGFLTFDVSATASPCKDLTINTYAEKVIIDGDTVSVHSMAFPYSGSGFVLDTISSEEFNIVGDFDQVDIWIPTGIFFSACLSTCPTPPSSGCIVPTDFIDTPANYNDDVQYTPGSTFVSNGTLSIIKTGSSTWGTNHTNIIAVNTADVQYNGNLTFDVSNASYACRDLTIQGQYWSEMIVDGDTLALYSLNYPYSNGDYTIDTLDAYNSFSIDGSFNQATVMSPNGVFFSACLDSCSTPPSSGCLNATSFTDTDVNYNNDTTYPVGSVLATGGNIEIIKTLSSSWSNPGYFEQTTIGGVNPNEIFFHGYLTFDVSNEPSNCKELTIEAYAGKIIVDGDTVDLYNAIFPYNAGGFTVDTISNEVIQVSGNFNEVTLWIPTGIFRNACLSACTQCDIDFDYQVDQLNATFTNGSSINANDADQLIWDFGDGNTSIENDPNHTYSAPGIYNVCLTIVNWDCVNPTLHICKTITVSACPSGHFIITPNNDGDADNVFIPAGSTIYDRNGIITKQVQQDIDWDGLNDSNQPAPMGYYVVKCGELGVFNITIVR